MSRETILRRIRVALGPEKEPARTRAATTRLSDPPRHPRPAFATLTGAARESRFIQCLETQGATVTIVTDLTGIPFAIATLLDTKPHASNVANIAGNQHAAAYLDPGLRRDDSIGVGIGNPTHNVTPTEVGVQIPLSITQESQRLFLADDARLTALSWPADAAPARWMPCETLGDGTAALTHAEAAVAETGTLVLASSAASPASLAFLPEVHIVAVRRDTIAASFEDAFAALAAAAPARLPRAVNLVSGPSRTGDIGGRIVKGAHGPRRLAVILYGPTPAEAG